MFGRRHDGQHRAADLFAGLVQQPAALAAEAQERRVVEGARERQGGQLAIAVSGGERRPQAQLVVERACQRDRHQADGGLRVARSGQLGVALHARCAEHLRDQRLPVEGAPHGVERLQPLGEPGHDPA